MHPAQVQGVIAMIDGLQQQLQALRTMVAGSQPRRPAPPQQNQHYLNDQEEQMLDQALGVPAGALQGQYAPQHAQAPWAQQQMPQQQMPFQGYQQPIPQYQQPGGVAGQVPPGWSPPPHAGARPYHLPNNLNEVGPVPESQAPPMPANQRAVMEIFRQAAQNGALEQG